MTTKTSILTRIEQDIDFRPVQDEAIDFRPLDDSPSAAPASVNPAQSKINAVLQRFRSGQIPADTSTDWDAMHAPAPPAADEAALPKLRWDHSLETPPPRHIADPKSLPGVDKYEPIKGENPLVPFAKRVGKGLYNQLISDPMKPVIDIRHVAAANERADRRAGRDAFNEKGEWDINLYIKLLDQYRKEEHAKLTSLGHRFDLPEPETIADSVADFASGITSFLTKLAVFRKAAPAAPPAAILEAVNQAEGGTPGRGAAIGNALSAINKIVPGKEAFVSPLAGNIMEYVAKPGAAGTLFAAMTVIEGGSAEDVAVSFAIPYLYKAVSMAAGSFNQTKEHTIRNMKAEMKKAGISIPDDRILNKAWGIATRQRQLDLALREGKITIAKYKAASEQIQRDIETYVRRPLREKGVIPKDKKPVQATEVHPPKPATATPAQEPHRPQPTKPVPAAPARLASPRAAKTPARPTQTASPTPKAPQGARTGTESRPAGLTPPASPATTPPMTGKQASRDIAPEQNAKREGGKTVNVEGTELPLNDDGTVTVYHRTDQTAEQIRKTGWKTKEAGKIYVGNKPEGQISGYGKNVIELRVKPEDLTIDDEFPSGEAHFTIKPQVANKATAPQDAAGGKGEPWQMTKDDYEMAALDKKDNVYYTGQQTDSIESLLEGKVQIYTTDDVNYADVYATSDETKFVVTPKSDTKLLDTQKTSVVRKMASRLLKDYNEGKLSANLDEFVELTGKKVGKIAESLAGPTGLRADSTAYDGFNLSEWIYENYGYDGIKFSDGTMLIINNEAFEYQPYSHRKQVEQAIKDGKPVPANVLADYPDLQSSFNPPAAKVGDFTGEGVKPLPAPAAAIPAPPASKHKGFAAIPGTPAKASVKQKALIHKLAAQKGLTEKGKPADAYRQLAKQATGKTSTAEMTAAQASAFIDAIQAYKQKPAAAAVEEPLAPPITDRPEKRKGEKVITVPTEERISTLKKNLTKAGLMDETTFGRLLAKTTGGKLPRYIDKKHYITEKQGKALLKQMHSAAELLRMTNPYREAVEQNPDIKAYYDALTERQNKQRRTLPSSLESMRYYVQKYGVYTQTPLYPIYEDIIATHRAMARSRYEHLEQIYGHLTPRQFHAITSDRDAVNRITVFLDTDGKINTDMTADELKLAKGIKSLLDGEYKYKARTAKFMHWLETGEEMPDYDQHEGAILKGAEIYDTQGRDALYAYLKKQKFGTINTGYSPKEALLRGLRTERPSTKATPKGHIKVRSKIKYDDEKTIFDRLPAYLRQIDVLYELKPKLDAMIQLIEDTLNDLPPKKARKIRTDFELFIRHLINTEYGDGFFERIVATLYSQTVRALILAEPVLAIRNKLQTLAFYPDKTDLINPLNKRLTAEDMEYARTHVFQTDVMRSQYLLSANLGLPGLRTLNKIVDNLTLYPKSDELNRLETYWAKINRVRRALEKPTINKMAASAKLDDLSIEEQKHALSILAKDGPDAFSRYVARVVTDDIQFRYERADRSPAEQSPYGYVFLNLVLYSRAYTERMLRASAKVLRLGGGTFRERRRGLKMIFAMLLGGALSGEIYRRITGRERNPYAPQQIMQHDTGGLLIESIKTANDLVQDIVRSTLHGDTDAQSRLPQRIVDSNRMFLPYYDFVVRTIEGATGTKHIDRQLLRQLRAAIDEGYETNGGIELVERDAVRQWYHIIGGRSADYAAEQAEKEAKRLEKERRRLWRDYYGDDPLERRLRSHQR